MTPKSKVFTPTHTIDHQNIEPDEITIFKEGKDHYLDALVEAALSYHQQQLEQAVREARIDELEEAGKAVSQAYLDHRLPELQSIKEDKSK